MKKRRDYRDYLDDIFESIVDVESFIQGITRREFLMDRKTINAVVRSIEIIGEAASQRLQAQSAGDHRGEAH